MSEVTQQVQGGAESSCQVRMTWVCAPSFLGTVADGGWGIESLPVISTARGPGFHAPSHWFSSLGAGAGHDASSRISQQVTELHLAATAARVQLDATKPNLYWNLLRSQHKLIITLLREGSFIYN